MTVSSTPRKAGPFSGDGTNTSFPFTFKCFATTDVAVYLTDADGNQTKLTTGYTVSLNADQEVSPGGSVAYPVAGDPLAVGETLDLIGDQAYQQGVDIANAINYQPSVIQKALDYVTILAQQLLEKFGRVITFPVGDSASGTLPPASERAGKVLFFDEDGNATVGEDDFADLANAAAGSATAAASSATSAAASFTSALAAAAAAALSAAQAAAIVLGNFLQAGLGAVARTFLAKAQDWVSVKDFGAIGDGTNHPLSERFASLAAAQAQYPFVTALTQSIDWAAFQAAHNSLSASNSAIGGKIIIPASAAGYYLSDTWSITKRVTIEGANRADQNTTTATKLIWPQDTTGIRLYSSIDSGLGVGADYSRLIDLNLSAQAKNVSGNGIHATCAVKIEHCSVSGFKGHAYYLHGQTGGGATGICDSSMLMGCQAVSNGGDGFRLEGNDTNVCTVLNCSSRSNGGWGYYDNGFFTNTYIGCHEASSVTGSYFSQGSSGLGAIYLGCYQEGANTTSLDSNSLVIGGVMNRTGNFGGSIWMAGSMLFNVMSSQRHVFLRNNVEVGRIETDSTLRNFLGAKFGTASIFVDFSSASTTGSMSLAQTATGASNRLSFSNGNGLVGTIQTNGSATAYNTSSDYRLKENVLEMPGSDAIARIMALRPVTYTWKADGSAGEGFIAHELQEHFPHAVSGEKDGTDEIEVDVLDEAGNLTSKETKVVPKYQGVDTSFLVGSMVAMLQEHQTQIVALKAELGALKAKLQ